MSLAGTKRVCGARTGSLAKPSTPRAQQRNAAVRAQQPKVVCLGEALFDMLADDKGVPKDQVSSWSGYPGGAPCNVVCGLGRLNIPAAFVSAIGKDEKGDDMMKLMGERNIDVSAVERVDQPTRDVYVVRTNDGDRIFDSFGQDTNTFCDCFIKTEKLPKEMIQKAEVLVTGTLGLAYPTTRDAMHEAVKIAKQAGTTVLIDVNWRPVFWDEPDKALDSIQPYIQQADLIKLTDEEVEWAFGIKAADALANPEQVAERLPNARGVLVTAGGDGMAYCMLDAQGKKFSGSVPVYKVDVQDTTGAGDAFTCGLMAYLLAEQQEKSMFDLLTSKDDAKLAVEFAAACGALTTESPGAIAAQPELQQVQDLVKQREGSTQA